MKMPLVLKVLKQLNSHKVGDLPAVVAAHGNTLCLLVDVITSSEKITVINMKLLRLSKKSR